LNTQDFQNLTRSLEVDDMKKSLDQPNRRNNPMHKSTDYSKQIQKTQMQLIN
jgi:hypothetical protein